MLRRTLATVILLACATPAFAQEARKIHSGESDKRGIYGETTPEEAEALKDEGIEVARLPWVPRADG